MNKHEKTSANDKPFSCLECDNKFSSLEDLNKRVTTRSKKNPFNCSKCDSKFTNAIDMRKHKREHESPFGSERLSA